MMEQKNSGAYYELSKINFNVLLHFKKLASVEANNIERVSGITEEI